MKNRETLRDSGLVETMTVFHRSRPSVTTDRRTPRPRAEPPAGARLLGNSHK